MAGYQRESKAGWAGMMMSSNMSDDSDSEDEAMYASRSGASQSIPASTSTSAAQRGHRESWSSRAAAVGSRPPDTASQNPPSLKLLGLKSVKDGGAPTGAGAGWNANQAPRSPAMSMRQQVEQRQQEEQLQRDRTLLVERQREAARNRSPSPAPPSPMDEGRRDVDQRDRLDVQQRRSDDREEDNTRHGSMINFGGTDGFGSISNDSAPNTQQRAMPPPRQPMHTLDPPRNPYENQPSTPRTALTQQLGLRNGGASSPLEPPRNPYADQPNTPRTELTNQLGLGGSGSRNSPANNSPPRNLLPANGQRPSPPQGSMQMGGVPRSLNPGAPNGPGMNGGVPLQRGNAQPMDPTRNAPPNASRGGMGNMPPPQNVALPSPVHAPVGRGPPPPQQQQQQRQMPMPNRPGFSESPGPRGNGAPVRRPSLFRRSKAFLMGDSSQGVGGFAARPGGAGMPMSGQPQEQRRKSLFRRSMAMLTGRGPSQAQQQQQQDMDDDSNAPAPRVQGFIDEKPKDRKSQYLGGGGMGDEWDFQGNGARFWKRFSVAQHKLQDGEFKDSEDMRQKVDRRRKTTKIVSLLGGVIIILAVIAIIIWRENVKTDPTPGAIDRQTNGTNAGAQAQESNENTDANTSGTSTQASNNYDGTSTTASTTATSDTDTANADNENDDEEDTTTTKKKHHKKHKKHKDEDERRKRDASQELEAFTSGFDASVLRRQVEQKFPSSFGRSSPVAEQSTLKRSAPTLQRMTRRRQHHGLANAAAHAQS